MRISDWSSDMCSSDLTRKVNGSMTLFRSLNRAVGGSWLGWTRVNATTVNIKKTPSTTPKWKEEKPTSRSVPVKDDEARVAELEELVVVWSRLSGAEALPVIVIGREDIERSGASSIAQVLSQRPEVSINNNGNTTVADGIGNTGSDFRTNATTVQLRGLPQRSEEHTSELQSLMRISYAVFCLKKKQIKHRN